MLDQTELIDVGPLGRNSGFDVAQGMKKNANICLVGWLKSGSKGGQY